MSNEPQIQARAAQHYATIPVTVTMDSISGAVDEAFPELFDGWPATVSRPAARCSSATWSSTWHPSWRSS